MRSFFLNSNCTTARALYLHPKAYLLKRLNRNTNLKKIMSHNLSYRLDERNCTKFLQQNQNFKQIGNSWVLEVHWSFYVCPWLVMWNFSSYTLLNSLSELNCDHNISKRFSRKECGSHDFSYYSTFPQCGNISLWNLTLHFTKMTNTHNGGKSSTKPSQPFIF